MGQRGAAGARGPLAGVALALLVLGPVAASWGQVDGGPARAGLVPLDRGPIDVLAIVDVTPFGERVGSLRVWLNGPPLVSTPRGLVGVSHDRVTGACALFVLPEDLASGPATRQDLDDCAFGALQGFDPVHGELLLCSRGRAIDPVFQARELASGELAWALAPVEVGRAEDVARGLLAPASAPADPLWNCGATAIDDVRGEVVALLAQHPDPEFPFIASDHSVFAVGRGQGEVRWTHRVSSAVVEGNPVDTADVAGEDPPSHFSPTGLALTSTGFVVMGVHAASASVAEVAAAWGTPGGGPQGGMTAVSNPYWLTRRPGVTSEGRGGSMQPVASGPLAAFVMGGWAIVVNPIDGPPLDAAPIKTIASPAEQNIWGAGPTWAHDTLVLPFRESVTAAGARDLAVQWPWTQGPDHIVGDVAASPAGLVYVAAGQRHRVPEDHNTTQWPPRAEASGLIAVIDIDDGRLVQELPTPLAGPAQYDTLSADGSELAMFMPPAFAPAAPGKVALVTWDGTTAILGRAPAEERPELALDTRHPRVGAPVRVEAAGVQAGSWTELRVAWGDGSTTAAAPGEPLAHAYTQAGHRELVVTVVRADGTTRSASATIEVGGTRQTFMQRAFAPENQDTTWGLVGLAIAASGAAIGLGRVRRRRGRLQGELDAVERAYEATRQEPHRCEATLEERRAHVRGLLLAGKLDEAQFSVLDARIDTLQQGLRTSALEGHFDFLPYGLVRTLRDMLADGRISAWEHHHVLQALDEDRVLTADQKRQVRQLVDAWYERDRGVDG